MASNDSMLQDLQGRSGDWIEIYNDSDKSVDIGGMFLTDDPEDPRLWEIPSDRGVLTTIAPQGYLIIWVDGMDDASELHAPFSLSAAGEELALFAADGRTLVDSVAYPKQRTDISYGRQSGDNDLWHYAVQPTPGAANLPGFPGLVSDTRFSRDRGFYDAPILVEITTQTPEAAITYTLDGSDPTASATVLAYTGPILVDKTTCLRARATRRGWLSSNVDTQTYLFLNDVINFRQAQALGAGYPDRWFGTYPGDYEMDPEVTEHPTYAAQMRHALQSLPTLSLVTDRGHLFNRVAHPDTGGIYIYTGHSSTGGQDWERPVSAEFFDVNGSGEFQIDCGLRLQGGESRSPIKMPKHSFSLRFREAYGQGKLDFPFFGDWPVDSFDSLQLRGFFNNTWAHWGRDQRERAQYVRDQWMRDTLTAMGHRDAGQGIYVHLYLNGMYWGLYNVEERPDEDHYAAYHGGSAEGVDAINGGSATHGTTAAWNTLRAIVRAGDWQAIQAAMDVDNFIDYMMANLYAGNWDLKNNGNWRAAGGGLERRPWRFYAWDSEHIMENLSHSGTSPSQDPTGLWEPLLQVEAFRARFGDRVHQHLFNGGPLTETAAARRYRVRADEVESAVIAESARWGDYRRDMHPYSGGPYYLYTRDEFWYPELDHLLADYFPRRTERVLDQFRSAGLYPALDAPVFYIDGRYQHGGPVSGVQSLYMIASAGQIYYTLDGSDPRRPTPAPQSGGTLTLVAEDAPKRVLIPTEDIGIRWRGGDEPYDDRFWNDARVVEGATGGVGYESGSGYEDYITYDVLSAMRAQNTTCYIRIPFQMDRHDIDALSRIELHVRVDDGFIAFLNGVEVASINRPQTPQWDSSTVNRSDSTEFAVLTITEQLGNLRAGDNVLAVHAINQSLTSSDFLFSAELIGYKGPAGEDAETLLSASAQSYVAPIPLTRSVRVKSRTFDNGDWSALNEAIYAVGPVIENLRISELMYHPIDPNAEFIELVNMGGETIDLNLVSFIKGVDFVFPSLELGPYERVVVVRDLAVFEASYGGDVPIAGQYRGSLDNGGERITLVDAANRGIHDFRYRDSWYRESDGGGFSLSVYALDRGVEAWSEPETWGPSVSPGGSPGRSE